ncbi:MAG: DUF4347 domain-containing protein, partial [Pirellulaceae bacterium]
ESISQYLSQAAVQYDAIHLVSHGFAGGLQLGNTLLTAGNLEAYASQFEGWRSGLTAEAELLLYGCSIADGTLGIAFVDQLSELLDVDIAASTDATGHSSLGGDWELEYRVGEGPISLAFAGDQGISWEHLLAANVAPSFSIPQPAFGGGDGITTTAIGSAADRASGVTTQADGKLVVVGYSHNGNDEDIAVARYNIDGTLDTTFGGGDGIVTTDFGHANDSGRAVTLQSDGKILVAGYIGTGAFSEFAVVRYNTDGTLDTTFGGGDGIANTSFFGFGSDLASAITLQTDG